MLHSHNELAEANDARTHAHTQKQGFQDRWFYTVQTKKNTQNKEQKQTMKSLFVPHPSPSNKTASCLTSSSHSDPGD